jgi:FdhE protein
MAISVWQRRIRRAEDLADQHPPVAELLRFYIEIARFHESVHQNLCSGKDRNHRHLPGDSLPRPSDWPELAPQFRPFLSLIESCGPASLSHVARELQGSAEESRSQLLDNVWSATNSAPSHPQEFLAGAFLQPYAEWLRASVAVSLPGYNGPLCPFCNRRPGLGVLRQQGDGASRSLVCAFCLAEWNFRRLVCPACGEENDRHLPVFGSSDFDCVRLDCCETCKTYTKTVDLTRNGLAEPVVDEIASAALDLWAQEHGYSKLRPNLIGL